MLPDPSSGTDSHRYRIPWGLLLVFGLSPAGCVYRNAQDRVAFAVHSYELANGARLVAVGKDAEEATSGATYTAWARSAPIHHGRAAFISCYDLMRHVSCAASSKGAEEVPIDGWNEMSDAYAFAYTDAEGTSVGSHVESQDIVDCVAWCD